MKSTIVRTLSVLIVALTAGLGSACGERLEPQQVADKFWNAMLAQDGGAVRLFVTEESRERLDPQADIMEIQAYKIGQTMVEDGRANVLTEVVIAADEPVTLPVRTQLVLENGQWRVDYHASVETIASDGRLALMLEKMRNMNQEFAARVDESLVEFQKAVPKIEKEFKQLEEELNAAVPALKQSLQEFARRLEEALKDPGRSTPPAAGQPQQHEI